MSLFYEILKVGWPVLFTVIFPVLCMYLESHESSTDTCWMSESNLYLFVYAHLYFFNLFHWGCILLQWERNNKYFFFNWCCFCSHCLLFCASVVSTLCNSMDCSLPGPLAHGIFQARILESVAIFPPSWPGIEPVSPVSPALQVDSLPAELSGKPCLLLFPFRVLTLEYFPKKQSQRMF